MRSRVPINKKRVFGQKICRKTLLPIRGVSLLHFQRRWLMLSSQADLARKLLASNYIVDETILSVIYLASKMCRPVLIEGPRGCGKTELAYAVARSAETHVERLQCYVGINEDEAIGKFDEALQRLFLETRTGINGDWEAIRQELHGLEFFTKGPLLR